MGSKNQNLVTGHFQLPEGWQLTTIKKVARVNEKAITIKNAPFHIWYIDIASVEKGKLINIQEIPFKKAPSRAKRIVKDRDTLISTVRPNLEHYLFVKEPKPNTIASTGFAVISAKTVNPRFLYYYITSKPFTAYLTQIAESHTSAYPAFNPDVIENAEIILPMEIEQRAIAHILGSLDDKIELNRRMNKTLEAIARAIFKSWFIDFDPVIDNTLRAGNPIPDSMAERVEIRRQILDQNQFSSSSQRAKGRNYQGGFNFSGLDESSIEEIYELFPDSFQDSVLGAIPKGWEIKEIGEAVIFNYGKALKATERKPGNVPVFGSNGQVGLHNEALVKGPGIIIGRKGNPGIVTWSYEDFFPIDTTFYVKKTGVISSLIYLFYALKMQDLTSLSADSAVPGLNRNLAYKSKILIPNEKILTSFDGQIEPLFQKIHLNEKESKVLTYLRDTLLPKLISGELRIPDIEKLIEEIGL